LLDVAATDHPPPSAASSAELAVVDDLGGKGGERGEIGASRLAVDSPLAERPDLASG
jgi:hypothetical protein